MKDYYGKMALKKKYSELKILTLIGQSFATSIDAFAVGISFAFLDLSIVTPVLLIGLVTFIVSMIGLQLGKYFGKRIGKSVEIFGGIVLIPNSDEKLKKRISSYKSSFNKEKKIHGYVRDGSGKRYVLFWFYLVLNDLKKSYEYIKWYEKEFPDDIGEPAQKLCWAITLYRLNNIDKAKFMLADLMFSNLNSP